jgi:hypothetical protein
MSSRIPTVSGRRISWLMYVTLVALSHAKRYVPWQSYLTFARHESPAAEDSAIFRDSDESLPASFPSCRNFFSDSDTLHVKVVRINFLHSCLSSDFSVFSFEFWVLSSEFWVLSFLRKLKLPCAELITRDCMLSEQSISHLDCWFALHKLLVSLC